MLNQLFAAELEVQMQAGSCRKEASGRTTGLVGSRGAITTHASMLPGLQEGKRLQVLDVSMGYPANGRRVLSQWRGRRLYDLPPTPRQ